jgi:hypothetical protein
MDGSTPDAPAFVNFVRNTGTRWLLTTPERWEAFQTLGLSGTEVRHWVREGDTSVIVYIDNVYETGPSPAPMLRPAPDRIQIDITDDLVFPLRIAESASGGWASPGAGTVLEFSPEGYIQLNAARTGTTVELSYRAPGWTSGLQLHALGWVLATGIWILGRPRNPPA